MKSIISFLVGGAVLFGSAVRPAQAANRWWDGTLTGGTGNGASDGGTATWDTTTQNWDQGNGSSRVAWVNGNNTAIFGGTAGTVSLGTAITVGGLQFDSANYLVQNNTLTLGTPGSIVANQNAAISSIIAGSAGLTKSGSGTLTLSGTNSYTGTTTINQGALEFAGGTNSLGRLNVTSSGNLLVSGGNTTFAGNGDYIRIGTTSGDNVTATITGGTNNMVIGTGWAAVLIGAANGTAIFNMNGGAYFETTTYGTVIGGDTGTGSSGTLNVSNGTFSANPTSVNYSLRYGCGTGVVNLVGGTLVAGVINLAYNNTVSATFNFNGGTLQAGANNTSFMPAASLSAGGGPTNYVKSGGAVIDTQAYNITLADALLDGGGGGGLTKLGSGQLTLSGANTYSGDTVISNGTLILANSLALQNSTLNYNNQGGSLSFGSLNSATFGGLKGAQTLNGSLATLTIVPTNGQNTTYSGQLTNASLTKAGAGMLTLTGTNNYPGMTTINRGTLEFAGGTNSLGNLNVTSNGNLLVSGGNTTFSANGTFIRIGGTSNDNVTATMTGGTLNMRTASSWANVQIGANNGTAVFNMNGGSYFDTTTYGTVIGGDENSWGTSSSGTLNVNGGTFSTAPTWAGCGLRYGYGIGVINLNGGTLVAGVICHACPPVSAIFNFNGGTLQAGANNTGFMPAASLSSVGGPTAYVKSGGAVIDTQAYNITIADALLDGGSVSGVYGGLTKLGSGTLTLSGTNTYQGATTISAGVLKLAATGSISNSTRIAVASGATFDVSAVGGGVTVASNHTLVINCVFTNVTVAAGGTLGGTGTVVNAVTNWGTIMAGDTNSAGPLTFSTNLVMKENSTYVFNYNNTTNGTIIVNGTLTLPTMATVNVVRLPGTTLPLANPAVLFSGFSSVNTSNFTSWVISGAPMTARLQVVGNQVQLISGKGCLISVE